MQELEQRSTELQRQAEPAKSRQQREPAQEEMPDAQQAAAEAPQPAPEPAKSDVAQAKPPAASQQEAMQAAEIEAAEPTDAACSRATPFREERPADDGTEAAELDTVTPSAAQHPASIEVSVQ